MRAMVLEAAQAPLAARELPPPRPGPGQLLLRVGACGVCRTDLHLRDGELAPGKLPLVLGHQIVGTVAARGGGTGRFAPGERVGVPWLGWTCGTCRYCRAGRENLCEQARFTGCHVDGGFAELSLADERFCLPLPDGYPDVHAAPLLCAGLIGYRALRMAGDAERVGLYGFGAAAHIVAQIARYEGRRVFAFVRPGDEGAKRFALELGAAWAGDSDAPPPEELDAALRAVARGGAVVCGGIHMSDIPSFPYEWLWGERTLRSVANLTRRDGEEFMALAPRVPVRSEVTTYPLEAAERALGDVRDGRLRGAAVLTSASG